MYYCKPERNATQAKLMIAISVIVSLGVFYLSTVIEPYKALLTFAGYIAVMVAILFIVRYTLTEFEYGVDDESFTVIKTVGNRKQVVCNLALDETTVLFTKEDYKALPSGEKAIIKYSLNQNMFAKNTYVFTCVFNGKKTKVEFEPNKEFVSILIDKIERVKKFSKE